MWREYKGRKQPFPSLEKETWLVSWISSCSRFPTCWKTDNYHIQLDTKGEVLSGALRPWNFLSQNTFCAMSLVAYHNSFLFRWFTSDFHLNVPVHAGVHTFYCIKSCRFAQWRLCPWLFVKVPLRQEAEHRQWANKRHQNNPDSPSLVFFFFLSHDCFGTNIEPVAAVRQKTTHNWLLNGR